MKRLATALAVALFLTAPGCVSRYKLDAEAPTYAAQARLSVKVNKTGVRTLRVVMIHLAPPTKIDPANKGYAVWIVVPGQPTALAGFLDLDGNGRNELNSVRNLIAMNGGIVDCYQDEGKCVGEITTRTRYLVLGDEPSSRGEQNNLQAYGRMLRDAERLGIRTITLTALKQKMGYKSQGFVQHFGGQAPAPSDAKKPAPRSKTAKEPAAATTGGDDLFGGE